MAVAEADPSAVILDLDAAVLPLAGAHVVDMRAWQEELRFSCSRASLARACRFIDQNLPQRHATVLMGSGDFHHLSYPLLKRMSGAAKFQLVVLDNHPDNMRYPLGIHCGSWISWAAALPQVSHVHVVGITSTDIGRAHAWENRLGPLLRGRLSYWSIGVDVGWAKWLGLEGCFRQFDDADSLVQTFIAEQQQQPQPSYLSIDKDVFSVEVARTNWDQGCFQLPHAMSIITCLRRGGLVGSDITGEVSQYRYQNRLKRMMSALDGQPIIPDAQLREWQWQQREVNQRLLVALAASAVMREL